MVPSLVGALPSVVGFRWTAHGRQSCQWQRMPMANPNYPRHLPSTLTSGGRAETEPLLWTNRYPFLWSASPQRVVYGRAQKTSVRSNDHRMSSVFSILSTAVDIKGDMVGCFLWQYADLEAPPTPPEERNRRPPARAINVAPTSRHRTNPVGIFERILIRVDLCAAESSPLPARRPRVQLSSFEKLRLGLRPTEPTLPDQESTGGKAPAPGWE